MHCNTPQHTAIHCNTLQHIYLFIQSLTLLSVLQPTATHCKPLQRIATHCNTFTYSFSHWNSPIHSVIDVVESVSSLRNCLCVQTTEAFTRTDLFTHYLVVFIYWFVQSSTLMSVLQRTAMHCNALQHTATHPPIYSVIDVVESVSSWRNSLCVQMTWHRPRLIHSSIT